MTESELELSGRLHLVEYLLRSMLLHELRRQKFPTQTANALRELMRSKIETSTVAEGHDVEVAFAIQARVLQAFDGWFDILEQDLSAALEQQNSDD